MSGINQGLSNSEEALAQQDGFNIGEQVLMRYNTDWINGTFKGIDQDNGKFIVEALVIDEDGNYTHTFRTTRNDVRKIAQATAERRTLRQQVEPIKKIEVSEELKFYDILMLEEILERECHENDSIAFVYKTNENNFVSECMSPSTIISINKRNRPDIQGNYMLLKFANGASLNVVKPNWIKNFNTQIEDLNNKEEISKIIDIENIPEPRTFYLEEEEEKNYIKTYKLVKLNIVVKPPVAVAPVEEERVKPNLEEPSNKRSKKRGGKHYRKTNKRGKKKTNKREKKVNKSKSKKVRR
jgi:hypothetical protein